MTARQIRRRVVPEVVLPGIDPILARVYAARHIGKVSQIDYAAKRLAPPDQLLGIEVAAEVLHDALEAGARIVFVGDFDADGATSCAVGILGLRGLGASDVHYLVPNRFEYGYGLSPEIVGVAATLEPDVVITVDNGISSHQGVAVARELGMTVIITDHHLPGDSLPPADAIVNPNLPGDRFPSKALAGVGVIFYVLLALRARLRAAGWFAAAGRSEPNLAALLDLVAVGTVADVVPLDQNNRILVAQGLARINAGKCRPGIASLLRLSARGSGATCARDLAFSVAPRLNAAGRLEDMSMGIECLITEDVARAHALAVELDELNRQRREIQTEMQLQADGIVDELVIDGPLPSGVCLFDPRWHEGIVGLIASRVKERLQRPVVAFARTESGELKGSARSIDALHIRDLFDEIATRHEGLLSKFGGHAMAAGLSLEYDQLRRFQECFEQAVATHLRGIVPVQTIETDGVLEEDQITLDLADRLRTAGPWGQRFPEPMFDDEFEVVDQRVVGERHLKLRLRRKQGSRVFDAIAFGVIDVDHGPAKLDLIRAVYRVDVNEYQGLRSAQLVIEWFDPVLAGQSDQATRSETAAAVTAPGE